MTTVDALISGSSIKITANNRPKKKTKENNDKRAAAVMVVRGALCKSLINRFCLLINNLLSSLCVNTIFFGNYIIVFKFYYKTHFNSAASILTTFFQNEIGEFIRVDVDRDQILPLLAAK